MRLFEQELCAFLEGCGIPFRVESISGLNVFLCGEGRLAAVTVPLEYFSEGGTPEMLLDTMRGTGTQDALCLYQDRWMWTGPLVRSMLRVRLGLGTAVYARNCAVRVVSAESAARFLQANHVYGSARPAVRLGLFRQRSTGSCEAPMDCVPPLVAVATFSSGRRKDGGPVSYEWVRYASLRGVRVVGGMGRLLDAFTAMMSGGNGDEAFEVMTYADREWYGGDSYLRLGFREEGERAPVGFLCDPRTGMRVHECRARTDCGFRGLDVEGMVPVLNLGSRRFVLSVSGRGRSGAGLQQETSRPR